MRVYALTEVGGRAQRRRIGSEEELKVLDQIKNNKGASDDELDVVSDRHTVRMLKDRGVIKELTS